MAAQHRQEGRERILAADASAAGRPPRVLIVYGYEPSGHAAAACALEEAGRRAGLDVSRLEVAGAHHPVSARVVARGYHGLLRRAPRLWDRLYRSERTRGLLRAVRGAYLTLGGARRLREGVRRAGADVVVCPQAAVSAVLAEARRRGELETPVVSVLTDYGAHPFWADPPADLVLVPGADAAAELRAAGVPAERLRVTGAPVHPVFAAPPSRAHARRLLGLPPAAPVAALTGGSKGLAALDRAAAALLREAPRGFALVLCGRNDALRRAVSAHGASGRLRAFGPQPPAFVAAVLAAADIHVGKPGGMTAAESLALGAPMVLTEPLPGQEEDNARFLLRVGAAVMGGGPESAARRAARLLEDPPALAILRAAALRAGRPAAAAAAVAEIRELATRRLIRRAPDARLGDAVTPERGRDH